MSAMMLAEAPSEPMPDNDDALLAARASSGDRQAFSALVERHYGFLHRVAWRWAGNRSDAEDIAQEACVRLARAIGDWRGQGAFTTWLYALTLNVARDIGRKRAREAKKVEAWAAEPRVTMADPAEAAAERLWAAVRLLPDRQREAVTLVHGEGLTHGEAADIMGLSEPTVSWHIHEARKRLKALVARAGDD